MTKYKAIIFDLDGTAIPNMPHGRPSTRLIRAAEHASSTMKLCAATGRPWANAKPIIDSLSLIEPCVISAGTQVIDPLSGHVLWEAIIEAADVSAIISICKPYDYELLIRNELTGEGTNAARRTIEGDINVMYLMGCAESDAKAILSQLANLPNIIAAGVTSWTNDGVDIHITNSEATKEHAIAELLRILGLSKADVVGVGDGNNDVHLFKAVGYKVAMGNATDLLKSQADEVCDSVEQDGLAKLIERFI